MAGLRGGSIGWQGGGGKARVEVHRGVESEKERVPGESHSGAVPSALPQMRKSNEARKYGEATSVGEASTAAPAPERALWARRRKPYGSR